MCPPPDAKAKKSADYVESKGVLAEKYDVLLHFAIAHMRRVDGALPPHSSGRKALDLLAKEGEQRWSLFPPCGVIVNVYDVFRYFLRSAQPIYGFWFYYMWENVVGPALEDINPKLNPKTASEVDELLATEIGMYVCPPQFSLSTSIICIICIMCIICTYAENADGVC